MNAGNYDVSSILEGSPPPQTVGLELEVVRITGCSPRHFVLLSEKAWGAWFHWVGRSVKCAQPSPCERCKRSKPKWRGYVHAFELMPTAKKNVIIELTLSALALLDMQLAMQPMRGTQCKIGKTKGGKHGRFVLEVLGRRVDVATLPEASKPEETLTWLWEKNETWDGPKQENE